MHLRQEDDNIMVEESWKLSRLAAGCVRFWRGTALETTTLALMAICQILSQVLWGGVVLGFGFCSVSLINRALYGLTSFPLI